MEAQPEEPAGGSKRSKRSAATAAGDIIAAQAAQARKEPRSSSKGKRTSAKLKKTDNSLGIKSSEILEPTTKLIKSDINQLSESEGTNCVGKGKGKSKGKQRLLRSRKSESLSIELDSISKPSSSTDSLGNTSDSVEVSSKGKKRKSTDKVVSKQSLKNKILNVFSGKSRKESKDQNKAKIVEKNKAFPGTEFDSLDLYSDLEDFVEFEDLLASNTPDAPPTRKKRCLRSASTEEKDLNSKPGPSGKTSETHVNKPVGESLKKKSDKTGKAESSKKIKGEKSLFKKSTSSRKTGSCASSSGRQSSTGSRGLGRVGSGRSNTGTGQDSKSSSTSNPINLPGTGMSGSGQQPTPQDNSGGGTNEDAAVSSLLGAMGGAGPDSANDSDESEMNRLQALLEARGLPSHLFGALGPRMHQLLHRTMSGGTMTKVQHLLQGLQATGDEAQQLSAVMEMCEILVMGNEDSLVGFPIKQVVPALIQLLQMEHNFEMMIHASRALTYMMEALPRSSASVVEGVAVFLEKLQVINCIDVAEQSLSALEMLSKRHGKAILQAGGISACLLYLDFFSIIAQRRALTITANCVQSMSAEEFHYMRDNISLLSGRLNHSDNKSVESVCLCFARLVDNFQNDQRLLKEIAVHDLLTNIQQLLVMSPSVISTSVFVTVVRMLVVMCSNCPDLAVILLKQKIAETLRYLLTGSSATDEECFEVVQRTPQEYFEIVSLIGELLPRLPSDGIFSVNNLLLKGGAISTDGSFWQWQDDRGLWHMYSPIDNKIVEAAYQAGEEEVSLSTMGRSYLLDFNSMQQINEDTGTARPVVRKVNSHGPPPPAGQVVSLTDPNVERHDSRAEILKEDEDLASSFIQSLFAVLYEVYSSSAGPAIRHKCLQTILRMIFYASPELLKMVLGNQAVSSQLACMLCAPDLKVVVGAIQMVYILMQKLPDVFGVYFRREGVMHQIQKLASEDTPLPGSPTKPPSPGALLALPDAPLALATLDATKIGEGGQGKEEKSQQGASPKTEEPCGSSAHMKLSDVLKRKRPPRRGPSKKGGKGEESTPAEPAPRGVSLLLGRGRGKSSAGKEARSSSSGSKIPFLTTLNPRTWGKTGNSGERQATMKLENLFKTHREQKKAYMKAHQASCNCSVKGSEMLSQKQHSPPVVVNKEKVRAWVREQCKQFLEKYFSTNVEGDSHPALDTLKRLSSATKSLSLQNVPYVQGDSGTDCLQEIASILGESDISPFEVIHSGLIKCLLVYLTCLQGDVLRDVRLRRFLHVFLGCPPPDVTHLTEPPNSSSIKPQALSSLVAKLMACLHQLEQFQVKVHDLPGGGSGSSRGGNALKFFTTHQLKCQLQRHPACTSLKQWKGGPVKIDPLALVQAIEKYLLVRGYGKTKEGIDEELSDDDNSDEEMEEQMASIVISATNPKHRLEFLIGDHVLPYNMTVYQAVKQFVALGGTEVGDLSDGDTDTPFGNTSLWVHTHTIWYRPASEQEESAATSPKRNKAEKSSKSSKKKEMRSTSPVPPAPVLQTFLSDCLPLSVTVQDASLETISLLRVCHALNRHWDNLYDVSFPPCQVLQPSEFLSSKLTAKANRQLQDPLIIMTGNLPNWLPEIGQAAPFLFPFDTRQMLFFATTFDRDRAVLRLQQDQAGESSSHDTERVGPRLDRKRREVSRKDILKQAEKVMDDMSGSGSARTLLEIHYENEVGTGLGPTLEFYALVSKELQRTDLDLWRGDKVTATSNVDPNVQVEYTSSPCGLFPSPLHRGSKAGHVNKVKAKFKFLGKFMAKALMDSRMIDLPLSRVFYKWLLCQEASLSSCDLFHVDRTVARSFQQLESIVHKQKQIKADMSLSEEGRQAALAGLTLDGCSVEDLDLVWVLPGHDTLELCKGGKDMPVTLDNLEEYLQLVLHWSLVEGNARQFEAFREGFESLFPLSTLQCFYPEELEQLFCGNSSEVWDVRILTECCRPDHGYTHDSQAVKYLFQVLSSYNISEQRDFLQFVTGSPRLPMGGFRSLNPPLTIVRKNPEGSEEPNSYLPSVMTCVNYLKLPDYSTVDVMRERLSKAAQEGQLSFHLS